MNANIFVLKFHVRGSKLRKLFITAAEDEQVARQKLAEELIYTPHTVISVDSTTVEELMIGGLTVS